MRRGVSVIFAVILVVMVAQPASVHSQTPEQRRQQELRALVQQLEAKEAQLRGALNATRAEKDSLQKEVNQIRGQINYMESLIQATDAKIELTDVEIGTIQDNIAETQKAINSQRATIGELIAIRDQQDQDGLLVSLVRFDFISDFFQQFQDVITVHSRLSDLVSDLKGYQVALQLDVANLEDKKGSLEELNQEQEHQQYGLLVAKSAKDKVLTETKGKESEYQKQVDEVERQKQTLFKELQELELKIRNGGLYIVHYTAKSVPPPGTHIFQRPAGYLTQGYGMTQYARGGAYGGQGHNGVDIAAGIGSPIKAIGAGQIVANGTNEGWGNWIAIKHPNEMVSVYAHMSSFAGLSIGAQVNQGQVIGYEGKTGYVTGSHLHLSLYRDFFTYIRESDGKLFFNYWDGSLSPCSYMAC